MGVQAANRAAAVGMLTDCSQAASVPMQVYPGRPVSIYTPTGFIDSMSDNTTDFPGSSTIFQHTPIIEVVTVWGLFDSKEAVNQRDAFVDAFHEWARARPHEAGARSLLSPRTVSDVPTWIPDWLPEQQQVAYYATRITLEGFVTD
jgi:hypothetical protein